MTKTFEVAIAILLLLSFVFFAIETYTSEYKAIEVPDYTRTLLLSKGQDDGFRHLVDGKDAENIYRLLYNDMDLQFGVRVCDGFEENCITSNSNWLHNPKKNISYYFYDLDKTLYLLFY